MPIDGAIAELERLQDAINAIPTDLTIYASVQETGAPTTYTPTMAPTTTTTALPTVTEIYNIYDPLAAVMLAESKRARTAERLEAILNG